MDNPYMQAPNGDKSVADENLSLKRQNRDMQLAGEQLQGENGRLMNERDELASAMANPGVDANVGGLRQPAMDRGPQMSPEEAVADAIVTQGIDPNELHQMMVEGGQDPEQAGMLIGTVLQQVQEAEMAQADSNEAVNRYSLSQLGR